jgi:hypothetical protein
VKLSSVVRTVLVVAALNVASFPAMANLMTMDGPNTMSDGSAGSWYDLESSFFGFGSLIAGPYGGANILYTDDPNTTTNVTVTSVYILFSADGLSGNDGSPLNIGGTPDTTDADASSACNVVGTPQFGPSVVTSITCQFADPTFIPTAEGFSNNETSWYAVIDLGDGSGLPRSPDSIQLTLLSGTSSVPEPGTIGLCLLGLGTIIRVCRAKGKKR